VLLSINRLYHRENVIKGLTSGDWRRDVLPLLALQGRVFALIALKSTHPVGKSMPPPLSQRGFQIRSGRAPFHALLGGRRTVDGERLLLLLSKDGSMIWDDDEVEQR